MHQRILVAPDETRHIWKLDGPLEDTPYDETRLTAHGTCRSAPSDLGPPRKVYLRGHVLQASRSPGCCRFQRPYHSLDSGPKVADLDDRLKASVTAERKATVCSNQQATSLTELTARFQQQLDSSRANDELIS